MIPVLLYKAKRQYLLTCKVCRYYLLSLNDRALLYTFITAVEDIVKATIVPNLINANFISWFFQSIVFVARDLGRLLLLLPWWCWCGLYDGRHHQTPCPQMAVSCSGAALCAPHLKINVNGDKWWQEHHKPTAAAAAAASSSPAAAAASSTSTAAAAITDMAANTDKHDWMNCFNLFTTDSEYILFSFF